MRLKFSISSGENVILNRLSSDMTKFSAAEMPARKALSKEALGKARLPDTRFHDLKHSSATLALERGVSPKVLQARLGHKSISTTMNIYGHVLPAMDREAALQLDDVFKRAK